MPSHTLPFHTLQFELRSRRQPNNSDLTNLNVNTFKHLYHTFLSTPTQFELRSRRQPNTSDLTNLDISFQSDITYRFADYVPT